MAKEMSNLTVLFEGRSSVKLYNGREGLAVPVTGIEGDFNTLGIGCYELPGEDGVFFASSEGRLIHAYRAMRIVETLPEIEYNITKASICYACPNLSNCSEDSKYDPIDDSMYREIQNIVPPESELDDAILKLRELETYFSVDEIRAEVKKGRIRRTAVIERLLSGDSRAEGRKTGYSAIVTPDEAMERLRRIPGIKEEYLESFLFSYCAHVDPKTITGIRYEGAGNSEYLLVGKSRVRSNAGDGAPEITIRGGIYQIEPDIRIGLNYGSNDADSRPPEPKRPGAIQNLAGMLGLARPEKPDPRRDFPLFSRKYDAEIFMDDAPDGISLIGGSNDKRLDGLVDSIISAIAYAMENKE